MNIIKKERGITLIVLIITIIIMLILCAVSITVLIKGDLINSAKIAVKKTKDSATKEKNSGKVIEIGDKKYSGIDGFFFNKELKYGDVNEDGDINNKDVTRIRKYLELNELLSEQAMKNADVNADERVDIKDRGLLTLWLGGWFSTSNFPNEPFNERIFAVIMIDELNNTETAMFCYPNGTMYAQPANPSKDGYTFVGWYKDSDFTEPFDLNSTVHEDITIYAKYEAE